MTELIARRSVLYLVGAMVTGLPVTLARAEDDPWPGLHQDVFQNRPISEEDGLVTLEAPVRAEDAALVPLTVKIDRDKASAPLTLTLLIEKNPAPVAATFFFGEGSGEIGLAFSTASEGEIGNDRLDPLFAAAYEASHEAVYNCLVAARPAERLDGTMQDAFPVGAVRGR